jgi:vacuolar-type H+-ATPase subunit I/STV1
MVTIIRKSDPLADKTARPVYKFETPARKVEEVKAAAPAVVAKPSPTPIADRAALVSQCQHEYSKTLLSRKALSNTIDDAVARNANQDELRDLYEKIKAYQPILENLFNRVRHVEQYGVLPEGPTPGQPMSIDQLKLKRKALVDEKSKTKKKLESPGNVKPDKILQWEEKLARANAEYDYIDEQIKKFEGKA